ncbi:hypothetical protein AO369_1976 [Moraxella catarrhalis]|nr:hypothetical protein AO369_1976 [Moraxella catarrhalis]
MRFISQVIEFYPKMVNKFIAARLAYEKIIKSKTKLLLIL